MRKQNLYYIFACFVIIFSIFYLNKRQEVKKVPSSQRLANFPIELKGFTGETANPSSINFRDSSADESIFRFYTKNGDNRLIHVVIGYWENQNEEKKINPPRYTSNQWDYYWIRTKPLKLGLTAVSSKEFLNEKGAERELVYYCYIINGKIISNEYYFRFLSMLNLLLYGRNNAALLRVSMPVTDEWPVEKAEIYEESLMMEILPLLLKYI